MSLRVLIVNIWSHTFGAAFFLFWPIYLYLHLDSRYGNASSGDKVALIFFMGVVLCFALSSVSHTLSDHSRKVRELASHIDHLGIVIVLWGSTIPSNHFGFHSSPKLQSFYESMSTATALGCAICTMSHKFRPPPYRNIRVAMYSFLGLSAFIPIAHGVIINGWKVQNERQSVAYFIVLGLLNMTGGAFYAARIPERWFANSFDIVGSSHQIMHVLVMCGAWTWTLGLTKALDYWHSNAAARGVEF